MNSLPSDYYLRFSDPDVLEDINKFHKKGSFIFHESVSDISHLHNLSNTDLEQLTGNELLLKPSLSNTIDDLSEYSLNPLDHLHRNTSCDFFSSKPVPFNIVKNLVSPLLSKGKTHKRGYPSGGALYPVECFICSLNKDNPWQENILHLLPKTKSFEVVESSFDIEFLEKAILPNNSNIGKPSFAVIYVGYIPKTIFKYKYRGYRLALMETGSMYMLLDLNAKRLGLRNRVWSAYTDDQVCKALGLNPALAFPFAVQFFGY